MGNSNKNTRNVKEKKSVFFEFYLKVSYNNLCSSFVIQLVYFSNNFYMTHIDLENFREISETARTLYCEEVSGTIDDTRSRIDNLV